MNEASIREKRQRVDPDDISGAPAVELKTFQCPKTLYDLPFSCCSSILTHASVCTGRLSILI